MNDERITAALISECTFLFDEMRRHGMKSARCGSPPELLVLRVGHYSAGDRPRFRRLTENGTESFLYKDHKLYYSNNSRKRSANTRGVYYEEACAECAYDDRGRAYITMDYGPRYLNGYIYDILDDGKQCRLTNGRLALVS